jgi:hypothetical protein
MRWWKLILVCSWRGHKPKKFGHDFFERCEFCRFPLAAGDDGKWHFFAGKVD